MGYSPAILKEHLGKKFDPAKDYVIDTHRGATARIAAKTHKEVGRVPDSTEDEKGTMIVLEILKPPAPKPKAKVEVPKPSTAKPAIPRFSNPPKPSNPVPHKEKS